MARVCEKNTCPRGIATHDPKFKALYQGQPEHIVSLLQQIAAEIRRDIAAVGFTRLDELVGRTDCLRVHPRHQELVRRKKLDLSFALRPAAPVGARSSPGPAEASPLNRQIVQDAFPALQGRQALQLEYPISTQDRAVPATLAGHVAAELHRSHLSGQEPPAPSLELSFTGSAGQSFGVFTVPGLTLRLCGEANDSVAKAMSGGKVVIRPPASIRFKAEKNVIIGNCALYGATGGTLYVRGLAGDRFAVRNSGALAVVEGTGLHPCEYMTNGTVVILGPIGKNLGSGMTGGRIFLFGEVPESHVNLEYIAGGRPDESDEAGLQAILQDYLRETGSETAATILAYWADLKKRFRKYLPLHLVRRAGLAEEAAQLG